MNTYLWCAVGLVAGGIVAVAGGTGGGWVRRIETIAVAMFGAVVGGDLVPSLLGTGAADGTFRASSLAFAALGAIVMLALLALMRRSVGPLKPHKEKRRR